MYAIQIVRPLILSLFGRCQEMAEYVPSPGYNERGEAIIQYPRKKGKMERDPNAPKRAKSAYLLYQNGMRDQFRRENPGMTFGYVL